MTPRASAELVRAARRGSQAALDELYARYGGRVLAFIRVRMGRALRGRIDSRDVLQTTLLKSFQRIDQFDGRDGASLMGWLSRIAENEIRDQVDFQGRGKRNIGADVPIESQGPAVPAGGRSPLSQAVAAEEAERLADALEALEPDHRQVIILRKFEELSFKEIAGRLQRSEDACRMLLARAMVALTLKLRSS
jgi:RNA polymerase sigma-70 factor (ECF subfamily)